MPKSFFYKPSRLNLRFVETPAGDEQGAGAPPSTPDSGDEKLGENGVKALNAERDARKAADQRVKDLEQQIADSKKSADELAAEALKTAQDGLVAAETRALKYEVAAEAGLDLKLAARLSGATREELVADAASLKELVGATPSNPKPDPHQGGGFTSSEKGVNAGRELFAAKHSSKKN